MIHPDSSSRGIPLLFVDGEPVGLARFRSEFEAEFCVHTASDCREALALLEAKRIGLVLADERLAGISGSELLSRVADCWPETVRVLLSKPSDAERLRTAIARGYAHEYVLKPWGQDELLACLERGLALAQRRLALIEPAASRGSPVFRKGRNGGPAIIVGADGGLRETLRIALHAAQSDATVLLRGETGTGKELVARYIHEHSTRSLGPFLCVNSAALGEGVLESELFGHERGAFTGAHAKRAGRFELADGGTLFLDEIGDLSGKAQVTLLRALQERMIERVGSSRSLSVDVRVVAATHRDLERAVQERHFREDLFYRVDVVPIQLPPLRERIEDLPALVRYFIAKHSGTRKPPSVCAKAMEALARHHWPGNIRELENQVQRALALSCADVLKVDDFRLAPRAPPGPSVRTLVNASEAEALRELLLKHRGNCARAARALGIPRTTLVSRAQRLGLL